MGNSKTLVVNTEMGEVVVRKMPLADYADLLGALDNLPKQLSEIFGDKEDSDIQNMSNTDFVGMLPQILAKAWPDIISVVAVPTDKDAEFLGELDFADAIDILGAILELNDVPRIIDAVKKMLALKSKLQQPKQQS